MLFPTKSLVVSVLAFQMLLVTFASGPSAQH